MACPHCGDESVTRPAAPSGHELAVLVAEMIYPDWVEHLRLRHPQEYARMQDMEARLAAIFRAPPAGGE